MANAFMDGKKVLWGNLRIKYIPALRMAAVLIFPELPEF